MHLIIDGYNLLHTYTPSFNINSIQLQWERDKLIEKLSSYREKKSCEITVVFDGWEGGEKTERKERKKGIEIIFSKIGEKADEVIKRLVKEKGAGTVVITSDREISRYAEKLSVAVIQSDKFQQKIERANLLIETGVERMNEDWDRRPKKGPSRRLSKREKRIRWAMKKL